MLKYDFTSRDPFLSNLEIKRFILRSVRPFFIYDLEKIKEKFEKLRKALPENFQIYYSMKANPNINIVKFLYTLGCGIEIASGGELKTAVSVGVAPEKIIFAGPGKSNEEIFQAIKYGIKSINVESLNELFRVNKIAGDLDRVQNVNIRINPQFKIRNSILQMGGDAQKFGVDVERLRELKEFLFDLKNVNLVGVHVFVATQILDRSLIVENFAHAVETAKMVASILKKDMICIDVGLGLGIPYNENEHEIEVRELREELERATDKAGLKKDVSVLVETGRFLVGESGYYVTNVIDKKISRDKVFVICNGGINHLLRTALINTVHPMVVMQRNVRKSFERVTIGGPLCTSLDFFARDVNLPTIEIGDYIVIKNSGAYGYSESMPYFLSHDFADEYLYLKDKGVVLVRKGRNVEDIISEQILIL